MSETKVQHQVHLVPRHEDEEHTTAFCVCIPISAVLDGVTVVWHKNLGEMGLLWD